MYGNAVGSTQLHQMIATGAIIVEPRSLALVRATHITLHVGSILRASANVGEWIAQDVGGQSSESFLIAANEYVALEPQEIVTIAHEGILGRFIPVSDHVDLGLICLAGLIEWPYGMRGERIRIGIKNVSGRSVEIRHGSPLVHMMVFDFRGVGHNYPDLTPRESAKWNSRIRDPEADGPDYAKASQGTLPK